MECSPRTTRRTTRTRKRGHHSGSPETRMIGNRNDTTRKFLSMNHKRKRFVRLAALLTVIALAFAACATQPVPQAMNPPGFWMGVVHGLTAIFALVGELFTNYRVYAFPNSG